MLGKVPNMHVSEFPQHVPQLLLVNFPNILLGTFPVLLALSPTTCEGISPTFPQHAVQAADSPLLL